MCLFSTPKVPDPVIATPAAAPKTAELSSAAGDKTKSRLRAASATVLTSGSGVTAPAATAKKTLLGA